jgi:hypothetical protein
MAGGSCKRTMRYLILNHKYELEGTWFKILDNLIKEIKNTRYMDIVVQKKQFSDIKKSVSQYPDTVLQSICFFIKQK